VKKICKGLTKQVHTVIVKRPGKSLDKQCSYSFQKDLNIFSDMALNGNKRFVNLLMRWDEQ